MSGERIVLALDTATGPGGVAVGVGGDVLAEVVLGTSSRHSELVLPAIEFVLRAAGARMGEVDAIVCGAGPGSFTGVRIAAATAKALAHARGIPLYTYSSLLAAAAAASVGGAAASTRSATASTGGASASTASTTASTVSATAFMRGAAQPVCALFDARRGEAYAGCWAVTDAGVDVVLEPMAGHVDEIVERVASRDPLYVGDGALRNRERIEAAGGRLARTGASAGCAGALIRLFALDPRPGPVDAARWEPSYIRAPNVSVPRAAVAGAAHGTST